MGCEWSDFDWQADMDRRAQAHRDLMARWDQMMRDVYGEDPVMPVVAARHSPTRYATLDDVMGVQPSWLARLLQKLRQHP